MAREKLPLINIKPENEAKARDFMEWYGGNMDRLRHYVEWYDEDLFTDAFLRAYEAIARRGTSVRNYTAYFLRTYRNTLLDTKKISGGHRADETALQRLTQVEFDAPLYEAAVETINTEVLDYVREAYDEVAVSLFEIYVGLFPDISYGRMADMLGISENKIWPVIGKIKKDVVKRFGGRKDFILSQVNF